MTKQVIREKIQTNITGRDVASSENHMDNNTSLGQHLGSLLLDSTLSLATSTTRKKPVASTITKKPYDDSAYLFFKNFLHNT